MIRTYSCNIDNIRDNELDFFIDFVSEDRKNRVIKMRNKEDARRSVLAELLVRRIVRDRYDIHNDKISFAFNEFGKPYIIDLHDFHFNVSHSGHWVVCAIGNQEVGIDIERIKPLRADIASQYFSPEENGRLANLGNVDEKTAYFFKLWTLKESYLKTEGTGLVDDLRTIDFSKNNDILFSIPDKGLYFRIYDDYTPGYCLAVCGYDKEFDADIQKVIIQKETVNAF